VRELNIILWIVFGGVAGWIASMIMKTDRSQGTLVDIILGIVGAMVGGFVMNFLGQSGVTGFDLYSLIVAIVGACIVIYLGRLV
jgi:uncharacterized membrane protein YeaQ/YmgE (transglycosylase-associated protein family)